MWREERKQMSIADAMVARRKGQNERLERICALLNWGRIEQLLSSVYAAGEGRPAYRPLLMLRALLLQQWYSLSDPELRGPGDLLGSRQTGALPLRFVHLIRTSEADFIR